MIYDAKCPRCLSYDQLVAGFTPIGGTIREPCLDCGNPYMQRVICQMSTIAVHPRTRFREHTNQSTGTRVGSMGEFKDDLKKKSERQSEMTGITHDYQHVPDRDAFGIDDSHKPETPSDTKSYWI